MKPEFWLLLILIFSLVIFIVLGLAYKFNQPVLPTQDITTLENQYTTLATWSQATAGPNPARNICQIYTYPGGMSDGIAYPGQPNISSSIVNQLTPSPPIGCIDIDQLILAQQQHTCQGATGAVSWCYRDDGTLASVGETEVYYSMANCQSDPCPGSLALMSVRFNPPYSYACIRKQAKEQVVKSAVCDIGAQDQLFRVVRVVPGATGPPAPGTNNGNLLQIYDRGTNLCLMPSEGITSGPLPGSKVILTTCGQNQGYVWLLTQASQGIYNGITYSSPQQVVYVGHLKTVPKSFSSFSDFYLFITTNGLQSFFLSGSNEIILRPFFWWTSPPTNPNDPGYLSSATYLDYTLFNILTDI